MQLDSTWHHELAASGAFRVGCGLENQGATCYINSTVQCLVHNPILVNLCYRDYKGSQICNCKRCALCYIPFRLRMSFGSGLEGKLPYPKWMIDNGLATLGTQSIDRLSATQQVDHRAYIACAPEIYVNLSAILPAVTYQTDCSRRELLSSLRIGGSTHELVCRAHTLGSSLNRCVQCAGRCA